MFQNQTCTGIFSVMMKYPSAHSITESAYGTSGRDMDNGYHIQDGQQSRAPYTVEQIVHLYDLLHKLGGPKVLSDSVSFPLQWQGQTGCLQMFGERIQISWGYKLDKGDKERFPAGKGHGMKESGILVSCSDYHIFKKLNMTRKQALEHYMSIVKSAIEVE